MNEKQFDEFFELGLREYKKNLFWITIHFSIEKYIFFVLPPIGLLAYFGALYDIMWMGLTTWAILMLLSFLHLFSGIRMQPSDETKEEIKKILNKDSK